MTVYVCLLALDVVLYLSLRRIKNGYNIYLFVMMIILFAVSSLRSDLMGTDYYTYIRYFLRCTGIPDMKAILFPNWFERGYVILNFFIRQFTNRYIYLAIAVNIVIFGLLYKYIKENVSPQLYALVLYVFIANPYLYVQGTFNVMRQSYATAIILYGIKFLYDRKWVKYCMIILLAAQFHSSAYMFLGLIIVRCIIWTKEKLLVVACISLAMNLFFRNEALLRRIAGIFGYSHYISWGDSQFNFLLFVLFVFGIVMFFLNAYPRLYRSEREKFFLDIYLLALSLLPVFVMNDVAYRVYIIFVFISLPAIPVIWDSYTHMGNKVNCYIVKGGYIAYYMALFSAFFYTVAARKNINYVPFQFFWEDLRI